MIWEILLILLIAVIVIDPKKLPEVAYTLGSWFSKIQRMSHRFFEKFNS